MDARIVHFNSFSAPVKSCASWLCSTSASRTPCQASSKQDPSRPARIFLLRLQLGNWWRIQSLSQSFWCILPGQQQGDAARRARPQKLQIRLLFQIWVVNDSTAVQLSHTLRTLLVKGSTTSRSWKICNGYRYSGYDRLRQVNDSSCQSGFALTLNRFRRYLPSNRLLPPIVRY